MARSWPIHVVVLVIFLAATVNCARTSKSKAIPKKILLEKIKNLVSLAIKDFQTVRSNVKTPYRNFDLISERATGQLQSSVRAIELLKRRRKPVATTPLPIVTKSPTMIQQPLQPVVNTTQTEACGERWTQYGASFFSFCTCTQPCSFNSARKKCMEKQARLAKCSSRKIENFILRSLRKPKYILLGGNDRVKEGTWRWPDKSLLNASYTNWRKGQPSGSPGEDCLEWFAAVGKWYDEPCDHLYKAGGSAGFVCEKKL